MKITDFSTAELIDELNKRGYRSSRLHTPVTQAVDGEQHLFCVSLAVDGRVDVWVTAKPGDFRTAFDNAVTMFSCSGDYDCGCIETVDYEPVNAAEYDGDKDVGFEDYDSNYSK